MKKICFLITILAAIQGYTQTAEVYYDYNWKRTDPEKAQYLAVLKNTDSGWLRKEYYIYNRQLKSSGLCKDSACKMINGTVVQYYPDGKIWSVERKEANKLEGLRLQYYSNGMMMDSVYYEKGKQVRTRILWHRTGYQSDSITRLNDSTQVVVHWFDDGSPAASGYQVNDRRQGKWQFLHRNGKVAGLVVYDKDKMISREYYNEDGTPLADTATANRSATFKKNGMDGWRSYLQENTRWPDGARLVNVKQVTVGVQFCINEEGKIVDAEVVLPFHPVFDKQALKIIEQSPKWLPEIQHNRKVKVWHRVAITFVQE